MAAVQKHPRSRPLDHGDPRVIFRTDLPASFAASVMEFCGQHDITPKDLIKVMLTHIMEDPAFVTLVQRFHMDRRDAQRKKRLARRTIYRHRHIL